MVVGEAGDLQCLMGSTSGPVLSARPGLFLFEHGERTKGPGEVDRPGPPERASPTQTGVQ